MAKQTWKLKAGATWRQKLEQEHPSHGKKVPVPEPWQKRFGKGTMVIPRPLDIDKVMRGVHKGKLITVSQIRDQLAAQYKVQAACPMTTGIFMRIVAEAAAEDMRAGKKRITPYWRAIKDDGKLNGKFPGGVKAHASRLRDEGFTIRPGKGKQPPAVEAFEKRLVSS
jgi:hypothetical protein